MYVHVHLHVHVYMFMYILNTHVHVHVCTDVHVYTLAIAQSPIRRCVSFSALIIVGAQTQKCTWKIYIYMYRLYMYNVHGIRHFNTPFHDH